MYNNDNSENKNTFQSWATGKVAMFTIGLLAGYALYKMGVLQQLTKQLQFSEEETDKQTIQALITVHKYYQKAQKNKQWKESNQLFNQFVSLRQKIENKLGVEFIETITMILNNFEELYQREWDLTQQIEQLETNRSLVQKHTQLIAELQQTKQQLQAKQDKLQALTDSYLLEKQAQLNRLIANSNNNLTLIAETKEEIKLIKEEFLEKLED